MHWRNENKDADLSKVYILNSAVSSQFAKTLAQIEGKQIFKKNLALLLKQLMFQAFNMTLL